jgi:hypothetical protein
MVLPLLVLSALSLSPSHALQCGVEAFAQPFGVGTAGAEGVPELRGVGGPLVGTVYHMQVLRGRPLAPGIVLGGLSEVDVFLPAFGGALHVGSPYLAQVFTLDAEGDSPPLFQFKIEPALCGLVAVAQAAVIDPVATGGAALTNALRAGFGVAQGPLFPAAEYSTGKSPHDVVTVDLDGDGALDLAVTSHGTDEVATLLGLGDGTLAPSVLAPVGVRPDALAAGDLDGDGSPDLVAANWDSDDISVLLGQGDGTLAPAQQVPLGDRPVALALGDLDQDGALDLSVASSFSDELVLLFGFGDGTFDGQETLPVADAPRSTAITDVDLDGWPDVLLVDGDGLSARLGLGGGALAPALLYPNPSLDTCVAADLDADGDPDVALPRDFKDEVDVLQGQGDGTFLLLASLPTGNLPSAVAAADFDADGWVDLVVTNNSDDDVSVLLGTGGGLFEAFGTVIVAHGPRRVATGDFDADGHQDFVTTGGGDSVSVRQGVGDGTFRVPQSVPKGGLGAGELALADLDDDGAADILVLNDFDSHLMSVIQGEGGGFFADAVGIDLGGTPRSIMVDDFNGDGHQDPCVAGSNFPTVVLPGEGDGTFGAPHAVAGIGYPLEGTDLDGDGDVDLVSTWVNGCVATLNTGDASFPGPVSLALLAQTPQALTLGDLDGDGLADLTAGIEETSQAAVLLGHGDGTFGPPAWLAAGTAPRDIEAADLDQDGDLDLAFVSDYPGTLAVLLGNGAGGFAAPATFGLKGGPDHLALGDLDSDGVPDAATNPTLAVAVLLGLGDGAFAAPLYFAGNGIVGEPAIGDLDGDGVPDVAASNHSWSVVVLKNLLLE